MLKWALYAALAALFLLHNDFWLWHNDSMLLGLPVGLTYHIMLCALATLLMTLLVKFAWPQHLDAPDVEDGAS